MQARLRDSVEATEELRKGTVVQVALEFLVGVGKRPLLDVFERGRAQAAVEGHAVAAGLADCRVGPVEALPENVDERVVGQQLVDDLEVGLPDMDAVTGEATEGKRFLGSDADQHGHLRCLRQGARRVPSPSGRVRVREYDVGEAFCWACEFFTGFATQDTNEASPQTDE